MLTGRSSQPAGRRGHRARRPLSVTIPAYLACLLCLIAPFAIASLRPQTVVTAASTTAPDEAPDGASSSETDEVRPWVRLDAAPEYLQPGTTATVKATVVAGSHEVPAGYSVLLTMQPRLLSSRSAIEEWGGESLEGSVGAEVTRVRLTEPIPAGQSRRLDLEVPADPLGLAPSQEAWGPRAIALVLVDNTIDKREAITRSFLVWNPGMDLAEPPQVTVIVPMTSDRLDPTTGLATRDQLAETAPGGRLGELLSLSSRPGVAMALDPSVLTVVPEGDVPAAEDEALQNWRAQVRAATQRREFVGLGYGDPDILASTLADRPELAELADQLASDAFSDAEIHVRRDLAIPAGGLADLATVDAYTGLGRTAGVVLDEGVQPLSRNQRTTPDARSSLTRNGRELPTLTADDNLSSALAATGEDGASGGANAVQRVRADTAALAREAPGRVRHVLVTAPREWTPSSAGRQAVQALTAGRWTTSSSLADLLATTAQTDRATPRLTATQRRQALSSEGVQSVAAQLHDTAGLLTSLSEPAVAQSDARRGGAALVSVRFRGDEAGWLAARNAYSQISTAIRNGIHVVPGSTVTQVSRNVRLPVTVRNDTDNIVQVRLHVRPTSNRLVVTKQVDVTVPAHSRAVGYVPVRGNGNGDTSVRISLLTPSGVQLGDPIVTQVQVRADWESVGTTAIGVIAALLVAIGLVRSIRRGTRIARAGRDPLRRDDSRDTSDAGGVPENGPGAQR